MTNSIISSIAVRPDLSELEQAGRDFAEYRNRVRDRAIEGYVNADWDLEQLNNSLSNLGLDLYEPRYVSSSDTSISVQILTDDDNSSLASQRLAALSSDTVRAEVRDVLNRVLAEHVGSDARVGEDSLVVYAGAASRTAVS